MSVSAFSFGKSSQIGCSANWWTEDDDRAVVVQLTHGQGVRLVPRHVAETSADIRVVLLACAPSLSRRGGLGDAAVIADVRIRLDAPLRGRRLTVWMDDVLVSATRVVRPDQPARTTPTAAVVPDDEVRLPRPQQAKDRMLTLLENLLPGDLVPSERELAERFGMARDTVRKAFAELVLEGRVVRIVGRGTVVAEPKHVHRIGLDTVADHFEIPGMASGVIRLEELPAVAEVAADLRIGTGGPVLRVDHLVRAADEPVALRSTYVSATRFRGLSGGYDGETSLRTVLRADFRVVFGESHQCVRTVLPTAQQAQSLCVSMGMPLLSVHGVTYDDQGAPVERSETLLRGDRVNLSIHQRDVAS